MYNCGSVDLSPDNHECRDENYNFNHLFFDEQSHGLSFTFELQSVDKLISQNGMWTKLNNHVMTFGSKLHGVKSFDSYRIHENRDRTTDTVPLPQLVFFLYITFALGLRAVAVILLRHDVNWHKLPL